MIYLPDSIWTENYSTISNLKKRTKTLDLAILNEKEFVGGIEALDKCSRKYDAECFSEIGYLYVIELQVALCDL